VAAEVSLARRLSQYGANAEQLMTVTMARATEIAMQFPRLRERLEDTSTDSYAEAPARTFEFGLTAILDGLQARLAGG
jgi:hypothetical protein